jgi:hypothetical protein
LSSLPFHLRYIAAMTCLTGRLISHGNELRHLFRNNNQLTSKSRMKNLIMTQNAIHHPLEAE